MGIFSIVLCAVLFVFFKPILVFPYSGIALFGGFLWGLYYFIYSKILLKEEVSRVICLVSISPIIVTLLAGIFLKEIFDVTKYIGIVLLVISGLLLSHKKKGGRIRIIDSLKFVLILILLFSFSQIIDKFVIGEIGYWPLYFWTCFGVFLTTIPVLLINKVRTSFVNSLKKMRKKDLSIWFIAELFGIFGSIAYYLAVFLGQISLVSAIGSLQPFFIFIITIFLSIFFPKILKEELNRYNILMKSIAIVAVFIGTWLLV
jgi:uncharacterized membrane protein